MKKTTLGKKERQQRDNDVTLIRKGVRGKYARRYAEGTNLVLLAPDVAKAFPTPQAVNDALRLLMSVAKSTQKSSRG